MYDWPKQYDGLRIDGYHPGKGFDDEAFDDDRIEVLTSICRRHFKKSKGVNHAISSYGMKHRLEQFGKLFRREYLGDYVSNGELIYAMLEAGFRAERCEPNAYFNVSDVSYGRFCKLVDQNS